MFSARDHESAAQVEMTIPSAVDKTLAPEGQHVVQLFIHDNAITMTTKCRELTDDVAAGLLSASRVTVVTTLDLSLPPSARSDLDTVSCWLE